VSLDDPVQLAEQVQARREQLGESVEELAHRLDVKARANERVGEAKQAAAVQLDSLRHAAQQGWAGARDRAGQAWQRPDVRRATTAVAIAVGVLLVRRCTG
jgi:hypothetical protein